MDLIIIAAGNGTRMGDVEVPKTLFPIKEKPNLWYALEAAETVKRIRSVYVVIKMGTRSFYKETLEKFPHITLIEIVSGKGDGHAIMMAMNHIPKTGQSIVMWGDAHIEDGRLFAELCDKGETTIAKFFAPIVVPVIKEQNPYVSFVVEENNMWIKRAEFSKFGEVTTKFGYHDQSVFLIDKSAVWAGLLDMHAVLYKGPNYASSTGDLNFLHLIHMFWNKHKPCLAYETTYAVGAFNTKEEALKLS